MSGGGRLYVWVRAKPDTASASVGDVQSGLVEVTILWIHKSQVFKVHTNRPQSQASRIMRRQFCIEKTKSGNKLTLALLSHWWRVFSIVAGVGLSYRVGVVLSCP